MQLHRSPDGKPSYCLGLTGGIACGKSVVAHILATQHGFTRVDADQVAREVVAPGSRGLVQILDRFGSGLCRPDGGLDRRALGAIVFDNDAARADLEAILHPLIWARLRNEIERAQAQARETVFELPLLYENGREDAFGAVWVVATEPGAQRRRLIERDGLSETEANARIASQMNLQEKVKRADFVICNSDGPEALSEQISQGLRKWRRSRREVPGP